MYVFHLTWFITTLVYIINGTNSIYRGGASLDAVGAKAPTVSEESPIDA